MHARTCESYAGAYLSRKNENSMDKDSNPRVASHFTRSRYEQGHENATVITYSLIILVAHKIYLTKIITSLL